MWSRSKRSVVSAVSLVLAAVLVAACGSDGGSTATDNQDNSKSSRSANGKAKIFTCCIFSGTEIPTKVAVTQGLFQKYGLNVSKLNALAPPSAVQALVAGSVDIGPAAPSVVLNAYAGGNTDLVIVAGKTSKPVYRIMSKSLTSAKDIKGKVLGVSGQYAPPAVAAYSYLRSEFGLEPQKDYRVLPFTKLPDVVPALAKGQVDAAVLSTPLYLSAQNNGAHIVADLSKTGLEANAYLTTTRTYLSNHREQVVKYVKAMINAMHTTVTKPQVAKDAIKEYSSDLSQEQLNATYDDYGDLFRPNIVPKSIKPYQRYTNNPKIKSVQLKNVVDYSILHDLAKSGFLKKMGYSYKGPKP